ASVLNPARGDRALDRRRWHACSHGLRSRNLKITQKADPPKYRRRPVSADLNSLAMSIREFCRLHGISEDQFFKMQREGWGPLTMRVVSATRISPDAAARWRGNREAAANTGAPELRSKRASPRPSHRHAVPDETIRRERPGISAEPL